MRLSIELDKAYGGYRIESYSIVVRQSDEWVWFELFNNDTHHIQKGGTFLIPKEVAEKLGGALLTMSDSYPDGSPPMEVKFQFDESQSNLTSQDPPSS